MSRFSGSKQPTSGCTSLNRIRALIPLPPTRPLAYLDVGSDEVFPVERLTRRIFPA